LDQSIQLTDLKELFSFNALFSAVTNQALGNVKKPLSPQITAPVYSTGALPAVGGDGLRGDTLYLSTVVIFPSLKISKSLHSFNKAQKLESLQSRRAVNVELLMLR
jgi:hypothetical protein